MRNMNLKKIICTLLAVLMIATMSFGLMACKNTDDSAATTEATATGTVDPTGATGDATEPTGETEGEGSDAADATGETTDTTATTEAGSNGHVHNYTKDVWPPKCETSGYDIYTCECGHTYTDGYYKPVGHDYIVSVIAPTATEQGYTRHKCAYCDYVYNDSYVPATGVQAEVTPNTNTGLPSEKEIANAVIKYVNQLRAAQGSAPATAVPGLTRIAEDRAQQLVYDFRHDDVALRALCNQYQYGKYMDWAEAGCPDMVDQNYYTFGGAEAIGTGTVSKNADELGRTIAEGFKNSAGHWRYVGDGANAYIGVGITYSRTYDSWYCCINLSKENYG